MGFGSSLSINGSDEILGYKSLTLSFFYFSKDGALGFCHVMSEEEATHGLVRLVMNRCLKFLDGSSNLSL